MSPALRHTHQVPEPWEEGLPFRPLQTLRWAPQELITPGNVCFEGLFHGLTGAARSPPLSRFSSPSPSPAAPTDNHTGVAASPEYGVDQHPCKIPVYPAT